MTLNERDFLKWLRYQQSVNSSQEVQDLQKTVGETTLADWQESKRARLDIMPAAFKNEATAQNQKSAKSDQTEFVASYKLLRDKLKDLSKFEAEKLKNTYAVRLRLHESQIDRLERITDELKKDSQPIIAVDVKPLEPELHKLMAKFIEHMHVKASAELQEHLLPSEEIHRAKLDSIKDNEMEIHVIDGKTYSDFQQEMFENLSKALGVSYEQLSKDYRETTKDDDN